MPKKYNTDEFIKKAKKLHGDKYNYDKVIYENNLTKVVIGCCKGHPDFKQLPTNHLQGSGCPVCAGRKFDTGEFILKARQIHGNKYNYDKTVCKNSQEKVIIGCAIHGDFQQNPNNHLVGYGCLACGGSKKSDTREFIEKSKKVHADKYNYDKVVYKNRGTKVIIGCSEHGDFEQSPNQHLQGNGCPICAGTKKSNTDEFILKAKEIHRNKYNYDKVVYKNSKTKVIIGCSEHGDFEQSPNSHLIGSGCLVCAGKKKSNTDEFILKAKEIHGDKYNYDKVEYKNNSTKVIIGCVKHGNFEQTPSHHLNGQGCLACAGLKKSNTDEFILKAKEIHGDKYNYDKVVYKNNNTKVIIGCTKHGDFEQNPRQHLQGSGCRVCVGTKKLGKDEFVLKAKEIHGDKYNYDKVVYKMNKTKVIIGCPLHGDFEQSPNHHLRNHGCPVCSESKGESVIRKYFEKNNIKHKSQYSFKKSVISKSKFDFATQKGLIEFHGEQHYRPCSFGSKHGGLKIFTITLAGDFKKEEWCKQHNIPLLVIPYWDIDRIPEIIDAFLTGKQAKISDPPQIVLEHESMRQEMLDRLKTQEI